MSLINIVKPTFGGVKGIKMWLDAKVADCQDLCKGG